MKTYTVFLTAGARRDLQSIVTWITEASGEAIARAYVARIRGFLSTLDVFPERGTRLADGVRRIGFEGRCTILFTVADDWVRIGRVLYAGRTAEGGRSSG